MKVFRLALLALLLMQLAEAQEPVPQTGVLTGSVFDLNHHPIASVRIVLQSGEGLSLTLETDQTGVYRATVPNGTYTVRARSTDQGEATARPVTISASKVTTLNLTLQSLAAQPQFFNEPSFVVAGVTDNTYRGGHGSDTVLRSAETLAKAAASLNKQSDANTADPHHSLGEIDERSGHPIEAVHEFQEAAESNPTEANIFDWASELLVHRASQPAADVFAKGVQLFPQSRRMRLGLATAWYSNGSYEQAAHAFFQACDLDPNDPEPYLFLGQVKSREITQLPGYRQRLARLVSVQPGNALANYNYAVSIWEGRKGPEDIAASDRTYSLLKKALAINSHLGPAWLQLGIVEASQRKYSAAIHSYRQAIDCDSNLEEAHYRLSEAYRTTGDASTATGELALYNRMSKQSADSVERERKQILQFVISQRNQSVTAPNK